MQYQCGGTESDDGAILYPYTIFSTENFVHKKGASDAVVVAEGVDKFTGLASFDVQYAVVTVHARVIGLDGYLHLIAFVTTSNDVVAQL